MLPVILPARIGSMAPSHAPACKVMPCSVQLLMLSCGRTQATVEMWESFRAEFLALWSAAVEGGSGGALAHPALFGKDAPDAAQALHVSVGLACSECSACKAASRAASML